MLDALRQASMTVLRVDQIAALALSLADRAYVQESGAWWRGVRCSR